MSTVYLIIKLDQFWIWPKALSSPVLEEVLVKKYTIQGQGGGVSSNDSELLNWLSRDKVYIPIRDTHAGFGIIH